MTNAALLLSPENFMQGFPFLDSSCLSRLSAAYRKLPEGLSKTNVRRKATLDSPFLTLHDQPTPHTLSGLSVMHMEPKTSCFVLTMLYLIYFALTLQCPYFLRTYTLLCPYGGAPEKYTRGSIIDCAGPRKPSPTGRNHQNHHKSDLIRSPPFWQSVLHR